MSWYQSPIQPFDPVVVSQQPKPPFRYMRDNFAGTGQNSYVQPPAQDQAQWQALTNVQPITQGILNQRWGYSTLFSPGNTPNRLGNYQSDALGTRNILTMGAGGVSAWTETGVAWNNPIFTPVSPAIMRTLTSRNFQYFCDGNNQLNTSTHRTGDSLKWNGAGSGGTSNIGISSSDVTTNTSGGGSSGNTVGPNYGTTATDVAATFSAAWTNVTGIYTGSMGTAATCSIVYGSSAQSDYIDAEGFFSSFPGSGVAGIQATVTFKGVLSGGMIAQNCTWYAYIIKNGTITGIPQTGNSFCDNGTHTVTIGGPTNVWGASLAPTDVIQSNFGIQLQFVTGNPNHNGTISVSCDQVQLEVFSSGTGGNSSSSGNGVGYVSAVGGGNITLTLGRTYYLIGANSTTGHFSDLSTASGSTGALSSAETNLVLATYNDPQVDSKYVLATADGGDPSILYAVPVLVPGLTISSWAIASNVVTFTGTWTGTPYANGTTFVVGGLSHGSYLNTVSLTSTSSSSSTLVASFTHGNDSATEIGVAGNYSTSGSIPNSVTAVVDDTTDPNLVTQQAYLFTDQFGSEFGVTDNDPPPAGNLLVKHQGRLWMAGVSGSTHSVFFTKSVTELTLPDGFIAGKYEEAWPADNYFDVSDGAESVSGLLSDGTTLYIGTQNHIRRLIGSDPTTFQEPQIVHPEVGLINQEVWQIVFMQGAPSGSIWMTPDFRVIQSDFNTYADVGTPVQNILNNLQSTAPSLAHAAFVADGEYELYILAVPYQQSTYCDTHLVFDLRNRVWFVWQPNAGSTSILYNVTQAAVPQWLFIDGTGAHVFQYLSTATTDNGTTIPVTATTTWMHLGEPTRRKVLNEIQVYGNTGMTVSVFGANNLGDFASPVTIASSLSLVQNPFLVWVAYLIDSVCKHRYYQFSFTANNGLVPFLGSYSVSTIPLDDV